MWSVRLSNAKKTPTSPTYYDGVVYVGCTCKKAMGDWIYAYDVYSDHVELKWATSGAPNWLGDSGLHDSSPTIYNYNGVDRLYIGCCDGKIRELRLSDGHILRTFDTGGLNPYNRMILSTPAIHNDVLFAGGLSEYMYAIRLLDFNLKWKTKCGDDIYSSVAIANGILYFGSRDGKIYAVNESNGNIIWSLQTGNDIFGQAAISDGILYMTSDDWYLYAIGHESGPIYKYHTYGDITSIELKKSNSTHWDRFYVNDTTPSQTSIIYAILDENYNVICIVEDGDDISSISQGSIILSASLETMTPYNTPIIHNWKVTISS